MPQENIHGMADRGYNTMVVAALEEADKDATAEAAKSGRKVMLAALRALSETLVDGSADPRAIALEQTLQKLEWPLPRPDLADSSH